ASITARSLMSRAVSTIPHRRLVPKPTAPTASLTGPPRATEFTIYDLRFTRRAAVSIFHELQSVSRRVNRISYIVYRILLRRPFAHWQHELGQKHPTSTATLNLEL